MLFRSHIGRISLKFEIHSPQHARRRVDQIRWTKYDQAFMVAARDSAQLCLTTASPIFRHEFRLNFLITTGNKNENNHVTKARMVCKLELLNQLKVRGPNTEKCMIVEYEECRLIVMRNAPDF